MNLIPNVTRVRSYDFWGNDTSYAEGIFTGYGNPTGYGAPDEFIAIRVEKRVFGGVDRTGEAGTGNPEIFTPRPEVRDDSPMMPKLEVVA